MENIKHTQDKSQEHEETTESQESGLEQVVEEKTESVEKETEIQENKDKTKLYEQKLQEILRFELKYPYLMSEQIDFLADSSSEDKILVSFPERLKVNFQRASEIHQASSPVREKIEKLNKTLRSSKKWYQSEAKFNDTKKKAREEKTDLENKLSVYDDNVRSCSDENKVIKKLEVLDMTSIQDLWEFLDYINVRGLPTTLDSLKTLVDKAKEFYTKKIENHQ